METKNAKSGIIKAILIIVAIVLFVFICWKAGWILNGNNREVSEQEKQEAIHEAVEEINATMDAERGTVIEVESELQEVRSDLQEVQEDLQEVQNELRDAFK